MLCWQPHPPSLSSAHQTAPSGARSTPAKLLLPDQTGTFSVPSPSELGLAPRRSSELLAELFGIDALRQPLLRELAALLRRSGADERELLTFARKLWKTQVRERDVQARELSDADVPVRRKPARARAIESATG